MNVLLVDVDSVWPNLALMKASTFHKQKGDLVRLHKLKRMYRDKQGGSYNIEKIAPNINYDLTYISCIFEKSKNKALSIARMQLTLGTKVQLGGSGIDLQNKLYPWIESCKPDYQLYNNTYGMGFITRGCIRNCPWCIVPKKEGPLRFASPLKDLLTPYSRSLLLFDNNLLAYEEHKDILIEMVARRLNVCFTQGLDIRLVTDDNANILNKIRCTDMEFRNPRLYFSWDTLDVEKAVTTGIQTLTKHRIPTSRLLFYVLCGHGGISPAEYTWTYFMEHDWYRYQKLTELGCKPFIMKMNNRHDIPLLNAFARWVNFEHKAKKKSLGRYESFKTYLQHRYPAILVP